MHSKQKNEILGVSIGGCSALRHSSEPRVSHKRKNRFSELRKQPRKRTFGANPNFVQQRDSSDKIRLKSYDTSKMNPQDSNHKPSIVSPRATMLGYKGYLESQTNLAKNTNHFFKSTHDKFCEGIVLQLRHLIILVNLENKYIELSTNKKLEKNARNMAHLHSYDSGKKSITSPKRDLS